MCSEHTLTLASWREYCPYRINMEFFWNIFPNKIVQGSFSTAAGKKVDQQDKRKKDAHETKKQASDSCMQIIWTCLSKEEEKKKQK